jgi:hypothetical protein
MTCLPELGIPAGRGEGGLFSCQGGERRPRKEAPGSSWLSGCNGSGWRGFLAYDSFLGSSMGAGPARSR